MAVVSEVRSVLPVPELTAELANLAQRVRSSVVMVRAKGVGGGSGVVWNDRGAILTNHHVVRGETAEIVLATGQSFDARVVARDPHLDLAVLQARGDLPSADLAPAVIGDSTRLRVGELVVAVGNPLGERNAVTLGVVSSEVVFRGRDGRLQEVVQAAISLRPGNSGGALADVRGRVVGIPHAVIRPNLALAVPSHVVEHFLRSAGIAGPRLGLIGEWVDLPAPLVDRYGLRSRIGLLLTDVVPDSPAERAGLTIGDVVVDVVGGDGGGAEALQLLGRLTRAPAGEPTQLLVIRAGVLQAFEVTPG